LGVVDRGPVVKLPDRLAEREELARVGHSPAAATGPEDGDQVAEVERQSIGLDQRFQGIGGAGNVGLTVAEFLVRDQVE
jgi:hypothetical protein